MPRPQKYENPTTLSIKIEKDLKEVAKRTANRKGHSLSELIQSYLMAYANCNSPVERLEEKVKEQEMKVEETKQKLKVLQRELNEKKEELEVYFEPNEVAYFSDLTDPPFSSLSESRQAKRVRDMANRKGVSPERLLTEAKKQIEEFDGLSGDSAIDM